MLFAPSRTANAAGNKLLPVSFNMRRLPTRSKSRVSRVRSNSFSAALVADCDRATLLAAAVVLPLDAMAP